MDCEPRPGSERLAKRNWDMGGTWESHDMACHLNRSKNEPVEQRSGTNWKDQPISPTKHLIQTSKPRTSLRRGSGEGIIGILSSFILAFESR